MTAQSIAETATLVHGFSMRNVQDAARASHRKCRAWVDLHSREEREEAAWLGIVEFLYSCGCGQGYCTRETDLVFGDLVGAGIHAIYGLIKEGARDRGMDGGGGPILAYHKYWLPVRRQKGSGSDGFSDQLCDRLVLRDALAAALAELTPGEYETVAALAAFDNGVQAAEALGITYAAFATRLCKARRKVKQVWVEDEWSAPRAEDTCKRGHPHAVYGKKVPSRKARDGTAWHCEECDRMTHRERGRLRRAGARLEAEEAC